MLVEIKRGIVGKMLEFGGEISMKFFIASVFWQACRWALKIYGAHSGNGMPRRENRRGNLAQLRQEGNGCTHRNR